MALEKDAILSDRLRVLMREMTAEESFDADEIIGDRVSRMGALKTYAVCSVRKINDEVVVLTNKNEYNRFLRNPIGDNVPLTQNELNLLMEAFFGLDAKVGDPNVLAALPGTPAGGSSQEP